MEFVRAGATVTVQAWVLMQFVKKTLASKEKLVYVNLRNWSVRKVVRDLLGQSASNGDDADAWAR